MNSSPPGLNLGAFTPDNLERLRQGTGLQLSAVLSHQQSANVGACIHPHLNTLLTAYYGAESRLDLWDLESRKHIQVLNLHGGLDSGASTGIMILGPQGPVSGTALPIRALSLSPDGVTCAVACANSVRLIGVQGGRSMTELIELHGDQKGVHAVAFSHNGDLLVSASNDGKVVVWSVANHHIMSQFYLDTAQFRSVAFSGDDLLVAAGDTDGNVSVWDVVTGHQLAYFQAHDGEVSQVDFAPEGYLMATGGFDSLIKLWDMASSQPFGQPMAHGDSVYDLAFSKDGSLLYSCSFDHHVGVWRLDTQELVDAYADDDSVLALSLSRDNSLLTLVTSSSLKMMSNLRQGRVQEAPGRDMGGIVSHPVMPAVSLDDALSLDVNPSQEAADVSMDGDVLIGELNAEYLRARRKTEGQSPPLPVSNSPFPTATTPDQPPSAPPPPPGMVTPMPFGTENSEPLIPARDGSAFQSVASEAAEQRAAAERLEQRVGTRNRQALVVAFVIACLASTGAYFTVPKANETSEYAERSAPILKKFEDEKAVQDTENTARMSDLERRLDKIKRTPGRSDRRTVVARIEGFIKKEEDRYKGEISRIEGERDLMLKNIEREASENPLWRMIVVGVVVFALTLVCLWLIFKAVFRSEEDELARTRVG